MMRARPTSIRKRESGIALAFVLVLVFLMITAVYTFSRRAIINVTFAQNRSAAAEADVQVEEASSDDFASLGNFQARKSLKRFFNFRTFWQWHYRHIGCDDRSQQDFFSVGIIGQYNRFS